jgi:hypothetical protein
LWISSTEWLPSSRRLTTSSDVQMVMVEIAPSPQEIPIGSFPDMTSTFQRLVDSLSFSLTLRCGVVPPRTAFVVACATEAWVHDIWRWTTSEHSIHISSPHLKLHLLIGATWQMTNHSGYRRIRHWATNCDCKAQKKFNTMSLPANLTPCRPQRREAAQVDHSAHSPSGTRWMPNGDRGSTFPEDRRSLEDFGAPRVIKFQRAAFRRADS